MNMYVNKMMFSLANRLGVAGGGELLHCMANHVTKVKTNIPMLYPGPIQCERTLIHASCKLSQVGKRSYFAYFCLVCLDV